MHFGATVVIGAISGFMRTKRSVLCIPGRHWVMIEKLTQAPTYTECVQYTGSGKYKIYTVYIHSCHRESLLMLSFTSYV